MADTLASYAKRLDQFAKALNGPDKAKMLDQLGKAAAKNDAPEAVRGDLGDYSMSNWWRRGPIEVTAEHHVRGDDIVEVTPTRRNRGPWRVLEEGRKAGTKGEVREVGFTKKGKVRRRKIKHTYSATEGKQTWSDATALMEANTPKRVAEAYDKVLTDVFR